MEFYMLSENVENGKLALLKKFFKDIFYYGDQSGKFVCRSVRQTTKKSNRIETIMDKIVYCKD